jgi:hypothetical protein
MSVPSPPEPSQTPDPDPATTVVGTTAGRSGASGRRANQALLAAAVRELRTRRRGDAPPVAGTRSQTEPR